MPRKPGAQPAALPAIPSELLASYGNGPRTARGRPKPSMLQPWPSGRP